MLDGNGMDKILFIVPLAKGGHLEVSRQLDLDLLGVTLFV